MAYLMSIEPFFGLPPIVTVREIAAKREPFLWLFMFWEMPALESVYIVRLVVAPRILTLKFPVVTVSRLDMKVKIVLLI